MPLEIAQNLNNCRQPVEIASIAKMAQKTMPKWYKPPTNIREMSLNGTK